MAENNVVAKLKESFASGTEKRAATKKISGNAMTVGVVVAVIGVFISVVNWLASKSDDGFLNLLIILALGISIYGLKFSTGAAKYYTQIVGIGILVTLGMYLVYGSYAPTVFKDWQKDFVQSHKDRVAQKTPSSASVGTPRGASAPEEEKAEKTEWVVTNLPVQLPMDDQGVYVPGKWSSPWEKPRGANHRCEYYSDVGVGRWYAIKTGENAKPLNLPSKEYEYVRLDDSFKTYYFMILLEGKGGFEVIQRCPA